MKFYDHGNRYGWYEVDGNVIRMHGVSCCDPDDEFEVTGIPKPEWGDRFLHPRDLWPALFDNDK